MANDKAGLALFHPLINDWFSQRFGEPTQVQQMAWPLIADGEHLLVTAPTGSGKTLTAFLWAINQLLTGRWEAGGTRVLYVSPLKALNNDVRRNLLQPLDELSERFRNSGNDIADVHVFTRSGDSTQAERRQILRQSPEILITTPESLNLLLSSKSGRVLLSNLQSVILDEIHAVLDSKRGVHLITAVDRLVALSGEFQRIALSATVKPLETAAAFVGGFYSRLPGSTNPGKPRPVKTVCTDDHKSYRVRIRFPVDTDSDRRRADSIWDDLTPSLKTIIGHNRSTLIFTNSRRLCEKITYLLNRDEEQPLAYAHHGSLSREIRHEVEQNLKGGILKAIVATSSLELGIDIGDLDEVILVQSPFSISSAIQKIGRAGHRVGEVSRGTVFPTYSMDILQAAVLHAGIQNRDIEPVKPPECPLDVLAQVIISMTAAEALPTDDLYAQLVSSYPYRNLTEETYHLVINMLAGRYADSRIRELKPRLSVDWLERTVSAGKGSLLALYTSGGTIPDRGYYNLRHHESHVRIGELDEEFVWEATIGKTFTLGTQNWRVERITHNDVFVTPGAPNRLDMPFWKSESINRGFHLSDKIAQFMETANDQLEKADFPDRFSDEFNTDETAARLLVEFLQQQKDRSRADLPHRHHLLVEYVEHGPGSSPANQVILHTLWGGKLNRPYAMALEAAWEDHFGQQLEIFPGNDCIVLMLPHRVEAPELLSMVNSSNFRPFLRRRLESSGFFAARFRECAGRALLITRHRINQRMPLWMSRLKSQKLMDTVMSYDDFPILLETWRSCLQDEFDVPALESVLTELETGAIRWTSTETDHPSPLAHSVSWDQINIYMYQEDRMVAGKSSRLRENLISEIASSPDFRPSLAPDLAAAFIEKRQRLYPGYAPQTGRDLVDWIKERLLVPHSEWQQLRQAMERDIGSDCTSLIGEIENKLAVIRPGLEKNPLLASLELLPTILAVLYPDHEDMQPEPVSENADIQVPALAPDSGGSGPENLLGQWLQYYGPVSPEFISRTLGISPKTVQSCLDNMLESGELVSGQLLKGGVPCDICDRENFEILLRLSRRSAIPVFEPMPANDLPLFLAHFQGLLRPASNIDDFFRSIGRLLCLSLPAELWENEILPARSATYDPTWLDTLMREGNLCWIGTSKNKIAFYLDGDLPLFQDIASDDLQEPADITETDGSPDDIGSLFPGSGGRYSFSELSAAPGRSVAAVSEALWQAVWMGRVSNDTFAALRSGIKNRFKPADANPVVRPSRGRSKMVFNRSRYETWKSAVPFAGNWFLLDMPEADDGLIAGAELNKERVRLLLDRYGILFRELLTRELPVFSWSRLFRTLRLMELSGEILSGHFFSDIPGPQFISHNAFRLLQQELPRKSVYWLNATDPVSLCGLQLEGVLYELPRRLPGNHLVYHGNRLVMVSERSGKTLSFLVEPNDPYLTEYLLPLRHLLHRGFQPKRKLALEIVNGEKAIRSPYLDVLRIAFEVIIDAETVTLYKKLV